MIEDWDPEREKKEKRRVVQRKRELKRKRKRADERRAIVRTKVEEAIVALKLFASDPLTARVLTSEHITLLQTDRYYRYKLTLQHGKEKKKIPTNKRKRIEKTQLLQTQHMVKSNLELRRAAKRSRIQASCNSPSNFNAPNKPRQYHTNFKHRKNLDLVLKVVAKMYYRDSQSRLGQKEGKSANGEYFFPTVEQLKNPLRPISVLDDWGLGEIALFEAGICAFGKNFYQIQKFIANKTTADCVRFYYFWKRSAHYQMWKFYGKPKSGQHGGLERRLENIGALMRVKRKVNSLSENMA